MSLRGRCLTTARHRTRQPRSPVAQPLTSRRAWRPNVSGSDACGFSKYPCATLVPSHPDLPSTPSSQRPSCALSTIATSIPSRAAATAHPRCRARHAQTCLRLIGAGRRSPLLASCESVAGIETLSAPEPDGAVLRRARSLVAALPARRPNYARFRAKKSRPLRLCFGPDAVTARRHISYANSVPPLVVPAPVLW